MSLKNKFFSVAAVAIGVVTFSTFTFAQEDKAVAPDAPKAEKRMRGEGRGYGDRKFGGRGHGKRHGGMMRIMKDINLTDAQKEQIKAIRESNKPDAAVMLELRTIREAKRAGTEITPEQQARVKAIREQSQAKMKLVKEQIMAVLTAEQRAQIEAKKLEMKQRHEDRKQKRQKTPAATTTDKTPVS